MSNSSGAPTSLQPWPVVITEWALDSYIDLKYRRVFDASDYRGTLRPDVMLLREGIPSPHPKFGNSKFWSPATLAGAALPSGYKMKWHNLGSGRVQLRLTVASVAVGNPAALLCEAYVKDSDATDRRKIARFKSHMNQIALGQVVYRGVL